MNNNDMTVELNNRKPTKEKPIKIDILIKKILKKRILQNIHIHIHDT